MRRLRRHLRAFAATWVVLQSLALAAFIPPSCCLGSDSGAQAPAPTHCHEHMNMQHDSAGASGCAMRAACGGQAAALFAALSNIGVLLDASPLADSPSAASLSISHPQLIQQFNTPDAPPPRSR
jgi:hypothetical protein